MSCISATLGGLAARAHVLGAFVRRDVLIRAHHKLATLSSMVRLALSLTVIYFVGALLAGADPALMRPYRGGFFAFIVLGLGQAQLFSAATSGISGIIRSTQHTGVLEAMLATPASPLTIVTGSALPRLLTEVGRFVLLVAAASMLFGFPWRTVHWSASIVTLVVSLAAYAPFGLLGTAFVIVGKADEPLSAALAAATALLGGVYFPRELLPDWLHHLGGVLPVTYAAEALRGTMLEGATLADVRPALTALAGFAIVGLIVGAVGIELAVRHARQRGSFGEA